MVGIKAVFLDIDGVLTDGTVLIDSTGGESKRISFDDIDAVFRIKRAGIAIGFLTGESTPFCDYVQRRFEPDFFERGCKDKVAAVKNLLSARRLTLEQVCFVGDSLHDVPLLEYLPNSFVPMDVSDEVKVAAKHVLPAERGKGVVRALASILMPIARSRPGTTSRRPPRAPRK
jgi:3-deoxy-D-manno-octulosonate 8-phosphate phosphatase (KDO 8-P phosphatase)